MVDADADLNGIGDSAAFYFVYAEDDGVCDGDVLESGVMPNVTSEGGEQRNDFVGICTSIDTDLKGGDGEVPRKVGDGGDLAVGDDVEGAVTVAQPGAAEREVFDSALQAGDGDDFSYVVLILDEDEDSVEHVLEDGLGAEADTHAEDTGGGQERLVGYVEDI